MTIKKIKNMPSDALFKKVMAEPVAAKEFLEYYLPADFKELIDLTKITVEKESFVEDDLKRRLSDIIYSVRTKDNEEAFVYVLIEQQSEPDYFMSFRLWKYMLLLSERHMKGKNKLPLILPLLFYNGKKQYDSPRNLWDLFTVPKMAKKLMCEDYKLIDLQNQSDDEITQKRHLGMLEYFLKHIDERDIIKLWEDFLTKFKLDIVIDKEEGYLYTTWLLWYTDAKLPESRQQELSNVIAKHLTEEGNENIMRTIAQKYIEEGEAKLIKMMLDKGNSVRTIAELTGLDQALIRQLIGQKS